MGGPSFPPRRRPRGTTLASQGHRSHVNEDVDTGESAWTSSTGRRANRCGRSRHGWTAPPATCGIRWRTPHRRWTPYAAGDPALTKQINDVMDALFKSTAQVVGDLQHTADKIDPEAGTYDGLPVYGKDGADE